jgi:hypothetical protein
MVLAQIKIQRPMEQNRELGYEFTLLCPPYFQQKHQKHVMENSLFSKYCGEKWLSACIKLELDPCLSLCTRINSKWIKGLNIRPETLKLVWKRADTLEYSGSNWCIYGLPH